MTWKDGLTIALLLVSIVQALLVYSFKTTLLNLGLELKLFMSEKYATKEELNLAKRIDRVDDGVTSLLAAKKGAAA
jgi:hypothetical protein